MARFAFFGPALGGHPGWVTTQGEVLAALFSAEGVPVRTSSSRLSPFGRAVDHLRDVVRWRVEVDVAVVSVFSGRAFALADEAVTAASLAGIPTVAWLHGGNLPAFGRRHPRWTARVLRRADAVVAPSAFLARWADAVRPGTRVIPNVLDLAGYPYRRRTEVRPRLLWMRTFQELYDPATAVRTVARLRADGVAATLTMAGQDKGLAAATAELARDLGVGDAVELVGFVGGPAKAALFDDHDVFLNTNLVDNAPVTVLEAAACGLVVVSSDAGGLPDLLPDGVAARLVPPGRPDAFAAAVAGLVARPGEAAALAASARGIAEASGWPAVRDRWTELAGEVAVNRRR